MILPSCETSSQQLVCSSNVFQHQHPSNNAMNVEIPENGVLCPYCTCPK